jgi:hypothetical protein
MFTVATAGLGEDSVQLVVPPTSWALLPLTVTFSPTKLSAWVDWALLQRHQGCELGVGLELLLDLGEFHQLLGELVGVERTGRILVL